MGSKGRRGRGRAEPVKHSRARQGARVTGRGTHRSVSTVETPEGYALYRVEVPLSKDGWGYNYTRAHPSMRLELLDRIEVGEDLLLAEVRMMGPGAFDWPAESRRYPNVLHFETLPEGPNSVVYRLTYRTPSTHTITRRHGVLTRYPIVVQNGISQFETFATQAQMRSYLKELRERVGPSQVGSVEQGAVSTQSLGLTPGQSAIFQEAVGAGFFQVPREITLTELADRLGRSKSTISTALVKIRKRLAESALQVDLGAFHTTPSVGLPAA
jgi:hypothetical protein